MSQPLPTTGLAMTEETIFAVALEKSTSAERSAYLNEVCAADPGLRQRVEALLQSHFGAGSFLEMPIAPGAVAELEGQAPGDTHGEPAGGEDLSLDFLSPSEKEGHLGRLAHYEVTEVIGRGGMGIVLKAFDAKLHRVVAIKVMAPQWAANATARKRFIREAQACAAVRGEHVIDIHAVEEAPSPCPLPHGGEGGGLPYLVMEYICGKSLQERLDESGPLELKEILRIGHQAASGLAAAHAQGLIHRDIKPANILLENSVERVKITDFGLARAVDDAAGISQSGIVTGTPQYMAPEQARGEPLDHRSDLFSLGSLLYAMCTGRAPFRAHNTVAVLRRVSDDMPRPIWEINPDIPAWLLAIIDKLHAKEPADRYQSAAEVAELLSQHLAQLQQPSVVPLPTTPPVSPPSQGGEKTRVPLLASKQWHTRRWAAAAAILLVVLAGLGFTEATGVTKVTEFVATVLEIRTPEGTLIVEVDDPNVKVTIEGDGGLVITGAGPQEVRLKPGSYRVEATKDGKPVKQELVTITRGGKQVVTVSLAGRAEPPAAKAVGEIRRFDTEWALSGVAVSPDNRHFLVSVFAPVALFHWDSETGNTFQFFKHPVGIFDVVRSPDGRRALTAGGDGHVRLWDVETGKEVCRFEGHTGNVRCVALSADGRYALSGGEDKTMRVWEVETGKELHCLEHPLWVTGVAISPDGRYALSSNTGDWLARLWDLKSGKEVRRFEGHFDYILAVTFSPDSRRALTASKDKTVRLWDVESGQELRLLHGHTEHVMCVAFSPDGRYALSGGIDKTVRLWDLDSGKEVHRFEGHTHSVMGLAFFPDGRRAVSVSLDKTIRIWQLPELPGRKLEQQAFVVLGGKGVPERKFDTLAEAVLNASDGDTIEVRGNGPFVSEPIIIQDRALTIRAADGFRPVIQLSPDHPKADLLATRAPLILEGLELQRPIDGSAIVRSLNAPLWVANCRLVNSDGDRLVLLTLQR